MKIFLMLILLSLLSLGCQKSPSKLEPTTGQSTSLSKPQVLVALGDSLTEGLGVEPESAYPAILQERLQKEGLNWEVVNAGVSGDTSSGALTRLDWVLKSKPDAVLLIIGANDGLRGIDPSLVKNNVNQIITKLKKANVKVMLAGMKAPANLGQDYAKRFEAFYPELAKKHKIDLIPFFLEGVAKESALNQEDGKHPNAAGYQKIVDLNFNNISAFLKS